jgi:O-acetyl-ADP-ribose deacetylase (regulator of RNase III)
LHRADIITISDPRAGDSTIDVLLSSATPKAWSLHLRNDIAAKIAIAQHDITKVEVDAIVTTAHENLTYIGPSQLIAMVHHEAGVGLMQECRSIGSCEKGEAVVTDAYNLPCQKVIHVVGPDLSEHHEEQRRILASCYRRALETASQLGLKVIAIPDLSTLRADIPSDEAAEIATDEVTRFLASSKGQRLDLIVFCMLNRRRTELYWDALRETFDSAIEEAPTEIGGGHEAEEETIRRLKELPSVPIDTPKAEASGPRQPHSSENANKDDTLDPWACCCCRAQPMIADHCVVCYHKRCSSCTNFSGHLTHGHFPEAALWLCELWNADMGVLSRSQWQDERAPASQQMEQLVEASSADITVVPRDRFSLDTLIYYGILFHLPDSNVSELMEVIGKCITDVLIGVGAFHRARE